MSTLEARPATNGLEKLIDGQGPNFKAIHVDGLAGAVAQIGAASLALHGRALLADHFSGSSQSTTHVIHSASRKAILKAIRRARPARRRLAVKL